MSTNDTQDQYDRMTDELTTLTATYGEDQSTWPAGQVERARRLVTAMQRLELRDADDGAAERAERVREALRSGNYTTDNGFGGAPTTRVGLDPWDGLDDGIIRTESPSGLVARAHTVLEVANGLTPAARNVLADAIDTEAGSAAFVVARSNPHYRSAFEKIIRNPERAMWTLNPEESAAVAAVESVRANLATDTGTGGYSIPLALDPTLSALTNDGTADPFRSWASVKQSISSPARALKSAGMNAQWLAEGEPAADATPTIGVVDVPLFKLAAWATVTYELLGDSAADLGPLIGQMVQDARLRAEGAAFAVGNGTTAPKGLVTAVAAVTGSTVTATTRGSFTTASVVDVYAIQNALPARARKASGVTWLGNNTTFSTIRQMSPAAAGSSFWVGLSDATPDKLLGARVAEASGFTAATTSGSRNLILGDLAKYQIADHIAGPLLEFVPYVFDQATGRPNYTRGWMYHQRTGADVLDANAFRLFLC